MSTLQTVLQIYDIWSSAALKKDEKVPRLIKTSSRNNTTDMEYWNTVVNWSMQSCHKEGTYSTGLTMKNHDEEHNDIVTRSTATAQKA